MWSLNVLSPDSWWNQHEGLRETQRWSWISYRYVFTQHLLWTRTNAGDSGTAISLCGGLWKRIPPQKGAVWTPTQIFQKQRCHGWRGSLHSARRTPAAPTWLCVLQTDRRTTPPGCQQQEAWTPSPTHHPSQPPSPNQRMWHHLCYLDDNSLRHSLLMCYDYRACVVKTFIFNCTKALKRNHPGYSAYLKASALERPRG